MLAAAPRALAVEELTTLPALEALEPEWRDLCARAPGAGPFQLPDWLLPWTRCFAPREPWVLCARAAGRLVGVLPLLRWRDGASRLVAPLGAGISDTHDAVLDPAHADAARAALLRRLAAARASFDRVDLEQLPPASPLLTAPLPLGLRDEVTPQDARPVVRLPRGAAFAAVVPAGQRRKLARYRRAAARAGGLALELAAPADAPAAMERLIRLHGARWSRRGEAGMVAAPELQDFHREVAARMAQRGALRLYTLRLAGAPIASLYAFAVRERLSCYLQGFAPAVAHLSPGVLLLGAVLEAALADGVAVVDLLRGQEPYKYDWGATDEWNQRRRLWPAEAA
ncbi:MAG TPA: GNAT family N-acetyltransferase [Polyangia bacterium]|jgi:CelD/BcsL family acetyltransferase involved in cellulose biosynthesis